MSRRIMTKLSTFAFALTLTLTLTIALVLTVNFKSNTFNSQVDLSKPCMAIESNLPMNHSNHPCSAVYMSNKSWLTWLSNENKSAHLHFLDLVELLHYSFH